ncbi:MAG: hypothetical protein CFE38_09720 [Comamonadaceae bacterium PBBC1]|nr:MAG: hypothetical protein CFE38_09720 [Comamonadaceae bacterium PBBC1]
MTFALVTTRSGAGVSSTASDLSKRSAQVRYFHQDHLNSIAVITDEAGQVVERLAYDPWGKRRYANGLADKNDSLVGQTTDRGYTEHEHLDEVGLIHMNGRVYDPLIGRFMSADPFIQSPGNLQSYNRYAYVMNNPLAFGDPSGYFKISIGGITVLSISTETVVRSFAAAADYLACGGYCSAAVGAHYGAQNGGGLTGAIVGGVSGYFTYQYAGNYGWQGYAVAAASGCANAAAHNASCGRGAASGLISKGASEVGNATGYEWTAAAAGGCASSRVGGGSCTDGIAQAWGSMATSYVMMGAATELKAAYDRDQYQANLYASVRALRAVIDIATDAGGGAAARGFWTWLVGGSASAALGGWAGRNWDKISVVLNVNGADSAAPPVPGDLVGDQSSDSAGLTKNGKRHTSGPMTPGNGGTGDASKDFDKLTGGNSQPAGGTYPPGTLIGPNGVVLRPGQKGSGPRIDIPGNGSKPPETLHY